MHDGHPTSHRAAGSYAHFVAGVARRPTFDPAANAWIVTEPGCCERLLASPHARPTPYGEDYAVFQESLGIDFSHVIFAFSHTPLFLHGDPHRSARRRVAAHLAARKAAVDDCIAEEVQLRFGILRREGRVEVMREVVKPLVLSIFLVLSDVESADRAASSLATRIFDRSIGPRKRQRLNMELSQLRGSIASRLGSDASDEAVGLRLGLFILGRDVLTNTMGQSLHHVLAANPGRRLDEIAYPEVPPAVGLPFTERVVIEPFIDEDVQFKAGDRLRIQLQPFACSGSARERARIFGVGAHTCLGKPLSLDLWRATTAYLAGIPMHADVISHALCSDENVFLRPDHLTVELHA